MWRAVIRIDGFAYRQETSAVDVSVTVQVHRATAFSHGGRTWLTRVEGRLLISTSVSSGRTEQFGRKHTHASIETGQETSNYCQAHLSYSGSHTQQFWILISARTTCHMSFFVYIGGGGRSGKSSMMLFDYPSLIVCQHSVDPARKWRV